MKLFEHVILIQANMCEITECPICMDAIDVSKNCVTTDCGHKFHTSCLMKNVVFNGFECPYCRFVMAESSSDDEDDSEYEENNDAMTLEDLEADDDMDDEDADDEDDDDDEDFMDEDNENYPSSSEDPIPSFELVFKKLIDKNVTYEQLVKCIMYSHYAFSFTGNFEEYKKFANAIDKEIYNTIINFNPEQEKELELTKYNFYFLEKEYKEREHLKYIETSIENLLVDEDNE